MNWRASGEGRRLRLARLQFMERRNGDGGGQGALRERSFLLQSLDEHFYCLPSVGGDIDGGGEKATAHPSLSGLRQAVAASKRQLEPAFLFRLVELLEGFACSHGHGIILGAHDVDGCFLGGGELQPGTDRTLGALFGPLPFQERYLDIGGFSFLHAEGTFLGRRILGGSLNVEKAAAFGKQGSKLAALDAADLDVVRGEHEDRG